MPVKQKSIDQPEYKLLLTISHSFFLDALEFGSPLLSDFFGNRYVPLHVQVIVTLVIRGDLAAFLYLSEEGNHSGPFDCTFGSIPVLDFVDRMNGY